MFSLSTHVTQFFYRCTFRYLLSFYLWNVSYLFLSKWKDSNEIILIESDEEDDDVPINDEKKTLDGIIHISDSDSEEILDHELVEGENDEDVKGKFPLVSCDCLQVYEDRFIKNA